MYKMLFAGIALAAAMTACTSPMTTTYKATLNGAKEKPNAITTNGTGTVTLSLDLSSKILTVTDGSYKDLSGAVTAPAGLTSGAHIHGPAAADKTAGVLFDLKATEGATAGAGTISGTTVALTDAQIADLNAGLYYVNLHTVKNGAGEIRGQLDKQ